jgi:hypothetical protein
MPPWLSRIPIPNCVHHLFWPILAKCRGHVLWGHSNNRVLLSNECVQSWGKRKTLLNTNYIWWDLVVHTILHMNHICMVWKLGFVANLRKGRAKFFFWCPNKTWTPPLGTSGTLAIVENRLEIRKLWPHKVKGVENSKKQTTKHNQRQKFNIYMHKKIHSFIQIKVNVIMILNKY